jgi:hypothetical protein
MISGKMMNQNTQVENNEMEDEYDFSGGIREKYYQAYKQSPIIAINNLDTVKTNSDLLSYDFMEKSESKPQN